MTNTPHTIHLAAVKQTLAFLADGWLESDSDWLRSVNEDLSGDPIEWTCCPLCSEAICDDNCPVYPIRDAAGCWIGSTGHPT